MEMSSRTITGATDKTYSAQYRAVVATASQQIGCLCADLLRADGLETMGGSLPRVNCLFDGYSRSREPIRTSCLLL